MKNKCDHTNIFESCIAQDIFVSDILDKIANDMKRAERKEFTKDNFEDFIADEFLQWLELGVQTYIEEEWGEND